MVTLQKNTDFKDKIMRILIIEDEFTLNKTIAEGLGEFGYQTDTSESFKDAEYYIGIRNYDLILSDWMLPDGGREGEGEGDQLQY